MKVRVTVRPLLFFPIHWRLSLGKSSSCRVQHLLPIRHFILFGQRVWQAIWNWISLFLLAQTGGRLRKFQTPIHICQTCTQLLHLSGIPICMSSRNDWEKTISPPPPLFFECVGEIFWNSRGKKRAPPPPLPLFSFGQFASARHASEAELNEQAVKREEEGWGRKRRGTKT